MTTKPIYQPNWQLIVLSIFNMQNENLEITASTISKRLNVTYSFLNVTLKAMQQVQIIESKKIGAKCHVHLTQKGIKIANHLIGLYSIL